MLQRDLQKEWDGSGLMEGVYSQEIQEYQLRTLFITVTQDCNKEWCKWGINFHNISPHPKENGPQNSEICVKLLKYEFWEEAGRKENSILIKTMGVNAEDSKIEENREKEK